MSLCNLLPCTCFPPCNQVVKEAEADAEAKYLQGVGVARQRQVCATVLAALQLFLLDEPAVGSYA